MSYLARLEPRSRAADLTGGVAARLGDPLWLLARQWQLGELFGDDASTPVRVDHAVDVRTLSSWQSAAGLAQPYDPAAAPLEAVVEAEPVTWTARRSVDVGRELLRQLNEAGVPAADREAVIAAFPLVRTGPAGGDPAGLRIRRLAAGRVPTGQQAVAAWSAGLDAGPARLDPVPGLTLTAPDRVLTAAVAWLAACRRAGLLPPRIGSSAWVADRHEYAFTVDAPGPADTVRLSATEHPGGPLDWYAFDASIAAGDPAATVERRFASAIPVPATFAGMPDPRWWTFEDGNFDLGRIDANPADLARMAVLEFALVFGNDFFVAPVRLPVGTVCRTAALLVTDNFSVTTRIRPSAAGTDRVSQGAERWTMFTLTDPGPGVSDQFLLAPTLAQQLTSPALEDVLLLRDEGANLGWAIERRIEGDAGVAVERAEQDRVPPALEPPETAGLRYVFGTTVPPYWFPLVPVAGAAGPTLRVATMADDPQVPRGTLLAIGDLVPDEEVPREGRRLWRERVLTRWSNGTAMVWTRRRAAVGRGEGSGGLEFDLAVTDAE